MSHLHEFLPFLFGNKKGQSFNLPQSLDWGKLSFEELLMFHALKGTLDHYVKSLPLSSLSSLEIHHLYGFYDYLPLDFLETLQKKYPLHYDLFKKATGSSHELSTESLQEILDYPNGKVSLFALLHTDRTRPGKLFIRRGNGQFVHRKDGSLWSIPVLGLSGRALSFNHSNGCTPCGVYSVDSVMPEANRFFDFGKFRRLIVNFIKASEGERAIKEALPLSHHEKSWWSECVLGRELGRSLLRIHGTGDINKKPWSPYFPMVPTSGCLATTETNYLGLWKSNHQRELLDALMEASGLPATYENESKIHTLLYVINFDGKYQALEFRE